MRPVGKGGVLQHITSLPGPLDIGDLGPEAYQFVDWLVEARVCGRFFQPFLLTRGAYSSWSGWPIIPAHNLQELVSVSFSIGCLPREICTNQVDFRRRDAAISGA